MSERKPGLPVPCRHGQATLEVLRGAPAWRCDGCSIMWPDDGRDTPDPGPAYHVFSPDDFEAVVRFLDG